MAYEFGLTNYFLHELGENLSKDGVIIENEDKAFNNKLNDKERIKREIKKIKDITNNYDSYLDINNENIKLIIVCIDLLVGIEISFKTSFIELAGMILENEEISKIMEFEFNDYDETIKESDKVFVDTITKYLESF